MGREVSSPALTYPMSDSLLAGLALVWLEARERENRCETNQLGECNSPTDPKITKPAKFIIANMLIIRT